MAFQAPLSRPRTRRNPSPHHREFHDFYELKSSTGGSREIILTAPKSEPPISLFLDRFLGCSSPAHDQSFSLQECLRGAGQPGPSRGSTYVSDPFESKLPEWRQHSKTVHL